VTLVFYISGHGYGHAVRDIEIIKALLRQNPQLTVHVSTCAPRWLFDPLPAGRVFYHERELDFGVLQENSFSADKAATLQRYAQLIERKEQLLDEEMAFLRNVSADIIVSDITPLAFDAAARFGKKASAIGNFSWDWIYADYLDDFPQFEFVVEDIRRSYQQAARLLRIPFYGDMSVFPRIENVPLVARRATESSETTRGKLGIPVHSAKKYVLLGLRMSDLDGVNWRCVEEIQNIVFIAISRDVPLKNCLHIEEGFFPFENVLNACDAVLSKPGYSMVSELIANQTPLLYVPRRDFAEDPVLIQGLQDYAVCEELTQQEFKEGSWQQALQQLFEKPTVWPLIRCDGAEVIAKKLIHEKRL
jgi:hypothetical protein